MRLVGLIPRLVAHELYCFRDTATPTRPKDKLSAPPVSGLLDTSVSASSQHLRGIGHVSSALESLESKVCILIACIY